MGKRCLEFSESGGGQKALADKSAKNVTFFECNFFLAAPLNNSRFQNFLEILKKWGGGWI